MDVHETADGCSTPGRRRYRLDDEVVDAFAQIDRLEQRDEVDRDRLAGFLEARQTTRRDVLKLGSVLGFASVASPLLGGADVSRAWPLYRPMAGGAPVFPAEQAGPVHTVPSIEGDTVQVGVFDPALAPILTIESGDTVVYPDTMQHYAGRIHFGMTLA